MTEAERLMGLLVRVIDAATQFGHPRNNDETDLDLAKRDFESALRELLPAGWLDIATAPKDGTEILLSNGVDVAEGCWAHEEPYVRERRDAYGRYIGQDESDGFDGWIDFSGGMEPEPTHWMPKPVPSPTTAPAPQPTGVARLREAVEELMRHQLTGTRDGMHALTRLVEAADAVCGRVPAARPNASRDGSPAPTPQPKEE